MLDAESQQLIDAAKAAGRKPLHESTVEEVRAYGPARIPLYGEGPEMYRVINTHIVSTGGAHIAVRVLIPTEAPRTVLVFVHGGGWVVGDIDEYDAWARSLAELSNVAIVLPNYRKAPEFPFPAALDDVWASLQWAATELPDIAQPHTPLLIGGDSSGGNLAIVTAQRALAEAHPLLRATVLIYPVTDADFARDSYLDPDNQLLITREAMQWFFHHYAGNEPLSVPEISPLRSPSFAGYPPTFVMHAEHDPLLDEGLGFVARLREDGVDVAS